MDLGYKANLISTLVDSNTSMTCSVGYKANLISTLVDYGHIKENVQGYKANLISTLVDPCLFSDDDARL